jgi:ketosteroid isomerase-like protein
MIAEILLVASALSASEAEPVQEVICAETSFSRAAERKDKAAFMAMVDPDARFISGRISRGKAEIAEAWSFAFTVGGSDMRWRPAVVEVTSDGQLAISRGPYRSKRTDENGALIESWGTFISTWRRNANGEWRVLFDTSGETGMKPTARDIEVLNSEPTCA